MNEKELKPKSTDDFGRDGLGRFVEGNPGRPKGTGNKLKKEVAEYITTFLADKAQDLYTMYNELDTREKYTLLVSLSRLVLPRPTESEDVAPDGLTINLNRRTIQPPIMWTDEVQDLSKLTNEELRTLQALQEKVKVLKE